MAYVSPNESLLNIYFCHICKKRYSDQVGSVRISCAVMHHHGECCHYMEGIVTDDQWEKIEGILKNSERSM